MALLIPAINARTEEEFRRYARIARELGADWLQVDVSDGVLGAPKNFADPAVATEKLQGFSMDAHLMTVDAKAAVAAWLPTHPTRITVHAEAEGDLEMIFQELATARIECGLALGPDTPLDRATPHVKRLDLLLLVAVPPGRSGQAPNPATAERIRSLRRQCPSLNIGVDGGITAARIPELVAAGATTLYAASAIFGAKNPQAQYEELKRLAGS